MLTGLKVAILIKQVPLIEASHTLELGTDGRLVREGLELEINPFCRRAITKGVELAKAHEGTSVVFTLGPLSAEDAVREALAAGADRGVLISDPAFAGSDTLATAKALAAAIGKEGPFDLVLCGLNSVDAETGQVGAQLAELLGLPFASGVRALELDGASLDLECERDDGLIRASVKLPALLSVAERLTYPAKFAPDERAAVSPDKIVHLSAPDLGPGPWGQKGSPTWVGGVRMIEGSRLARRFEGSIDQQIDEVMTLIRGRNALGSNSHVTAGSVPENHEERDAVLVVLEPGRERFARELLGGAAQLAHELGGYVCAVVSGAPASAVALGGYGADRLVRLVASGPIGPEGVSRAIVELADQLHPSVMLAPSSSWGREVAARFAAATESGLTGDASALEVQDGRLLAWKPAFGGQLEASIVCISAIQCATVRAGALPLLLPRHKVASEHQFDVTLADRVSYFDHRVDEAADKIQSAPVLLSVGAGVDPERYGELDRLAKVLEAELVATRKVTDKGWLPRTRQVGITGLHVRPSLCIVIGAAGKFNHMVGLRGAGTVIGVNADPTSPLFDESDAAIAGDWAEVVAALTKRFEEQLGD